MEAQFLSGELLSNPHFLRGGGGCHDVQIKNHSDIRNQSRVSRRCLGYELLTENKKRKNKEPTKNKEPKTCLDVRLRVTKGYA